MWRKHSARDIQRYQIQVLKAILDLAALEQHFPLPGRSAQAQVSLHIQIALCCIDKATKGPELDVESGPNKS